MKHFHVQVVSDKHNIRERFLIRKAKHERQAIAIVANILRKRHPGLSIYLADHEVRAEECEKTECLNKGTQQKLF